MSRGSHNPLPWSCWVELEEKEHLSQERMSREGPALADGSWPCPWSMVGCHQALLVGGEAQAGLWDRTHQRQRPHARTLLRAVNDIPAIKLELMQR